jgi:uncharacterized ParB-like nuclease family protein
VKLDVLRASYARLRARHASFERSPHPPFVHPEPDSLTDAAELVAAIDRWFTCHGDFEQAAECDRCLGAQEFSSGPCVYCGYCGQPAAEEEEKSMTVRPKKKGATVATPPTVDVEIGRIMMDAALQARVSLSKSTIGEYGECIDELPPVELFLDVNGAYWIGDGNHRIQAATLAGRATIKARVRHGTRRDALLHAVGANVPHGLRRSNADKRRAVRLVLEDPSWSKESDRWIAKTCGVSHTFVSSMRNEGDVVEAFKTAVESLEKLGKNPTEADLRTATVNVETAAARIAALTEVIRTVDEALRGAP